jgi:predicted DNA-binding transcriptional regulator AlpA
MNYETQLFIHAINIKSFCTILSCSPATIWRRVKNDPLCPKPFKNGRSTLWDYQEVLAWIEACKLLRGTR